MRELIIADKNDFIEVANAIRGKLGTSNALSFPGDFIESIEGIENGAGGNNEVEDVMISGTLSSYFNDRVTTIGSHAFHGASKLMTVSFPIARDIGSYAFADCSRLVSISFPAAIYVRSEAFRDCIGLVNIELSSCLQIEQWGFDGCSNLASINFPNVTTIKANSFSRCCNLIKVNLPQLPTVASYAFYGCNKLKMASFASCTNLSGYAFASCYNLSSLIIGGSKVCYLYNSSPFLSTPYVGYSASFSGTPYIYVPSSLITSYKASTNWVYFSSYFRAIEDAIIQEPSIDSVSTFFIESTEYSVRRGMTWADWVNSSYNTDGFQIKTGNFIYSHDNNTLYKGTEGDCYKDEIIIAGFKYFIEESLPMPPGRG